MMDSKRSDEEHFQLHSEIEETKEHSDNPYDTANCGEDYQNTFNTLQGNRDSYSSVRD